MECARQQGKKARAEWRGGGVEKRRAQGCGDSKAGGENESQTCPRSGTSAESRSGRRAGHNVSKCATSQFPQLAGVTATRHSTPTGPLVDLPLPSLAPLLRLTLLHPPPLVLPARRRERSGESLAQATNFFVTQTGEGREFGRFGEDEVGEGLRRSPGQLLNNVTDSDANARQSC